MISKLISGTMNKKLTNLFNGISDIAIRMTKLEKKEYNIFKYKKKIKEIVLFNLAYNEYLNRKKKDKKKSKDCLSIHY